MWETEWALIWIAGWITMAGILNYFSISWEWLIIMSVMLVLDFVFWIIDAKVRWETIESHKCQQWLVKKMTRRVLPFLIAWWLKWTWMDWIAELVAVIVWMIVFSELYSIIWHIYSINYKEKLPELDSFKLLLNWIVKIIKTLINKESWVMKEDNLPSNKTKDEKKE